MNSSPQTWLIDTMASTNSGNVWSKKNKSENKNSMGPNAGSPSNPWGSSQEKNDKMYQFELESNSSGSSVSGSGHNSTLSFGMESKKFNWGSKADESTVNSTNGVSSGRRIDWGGLVNSVFKEETGKKGN
jgi:hypothetical protein